MHLYDIRSLSPTPMVLLSLPIAVIFMLDSSPKVTNSSCDIPNPAPHLHRIDSSFYYTCCQGWPLTRSTFNCFLNSIDFRLHVYDMTSPPAKYIKPRKNPRRRAPFFDDHEPDHESTLKILKTIQGHPGRWTITDSHLSPDNERQGFEYIQIS